MGATITLHDHDDGDTNETLKRLEGGGELVMMTLGIVWLAVVVAELVTSVPVWVQHVGTAIWAIFLADFALRLWLAPSRARYLRRNWLTLVALLIPALRVFRVVRFIRVLRAARAVRGVRALRIVTSFSRAKKSIHGLLARRNALGYAVSLTIAVVLLGAAGMFAFEQGNANPFDSYGHAVWWTAMLVMTMGTDGWPQTLEGRLLSLVVALYGFATFGYITASLASWFIGRTRPTNVAEPS